MVFLWKKFVKRHSIDNSCHLSCFYCELFSTRESTAFMSEKAWNSLQWEPDFARPDRVTSQLNDITEVVASENGTKYLKINQKAFDSAEK